MAGRATGNTSRFSWCKMCLQIYIMVVGRTQSLTGCWTEGPSSSLAVGQSSPSTFSNLSNMAACFNKAYKPRRQEKERVPARDRHRGQPFNLIMEVVSHHLLYFLPKNQFTSPAHTPRGQLHKGVNTRRWALIGGQFRSCQT